MYNPFYLSNKNILVTGASSGIGRAIAIECVKLGANVIITGRDETRLHETALMMENAQPLEIVADLTDYSEIERVVKKIDKLDGVVLCAGRGNTMPFQFATREKLNEVFDINFFSPVELVRQFYKKKKISKGGSIVFIASIGGNYIHEIGNSLYGSSKAALNSMMKFCAREFSSRLIRVNSICPGMVETPLIRKGTISDEQMEMYKEKYPLGRFGRPEEIAYSAVFLLSDASAWITGQSLVIDGGSTIN